MNKVKRVFDKKLYKTSGYHVEYFKDENGCKQGEITFYHSSDNTFAGKKSYKDDILHGTCYDSKMKPSFGYINGELFKDLDLYKIALIKERYENK